MIKVTMSRNYDPAAFIADVNDTTARIQYNGGAIVDIKYAAIVRNGTTYDCALIIYDDGCCPVHHNTEEEEKR